MKTILYILALIVSFFLGVISVEPRVITQTMVTEDVKTPLYTLAELKMNDLLSTGTWSHANSDGKTLEDRRKIAGHNGMVGEVLAKGKCSIQEVVSMWMNSPSHEKIIVSKQYDKAVIIFNRAIVERTNANGKKEKVQYCYWVGEYIK